MGSVTEQEKAIKRGSPARSDYESQAPQSFGCGSSWPAVPMSVPRLNKSVAGWDSEGERALVSEGELVR